MKRDRRYRILFTLIACVLLTSSNGIGQNHFIDSLKNDALSNNTILKVDALNQLAKTYRKIDLDSSIYFSEQSLKYTSPDYLWEKHLTALDNLSLIFWHKKQHQDAIDLVDSALAISYRHHSWYDIAYFENANGYNYLDLADYPHCLPYFKRSLAATRELGDKKKEAYILNNLSANYTKLGTYDKALEYSLASLKIKEELGDELTLAKSYLNLGGLQTKLENYNEGMVYFNQALTIFSKLEDHEHMGLCYQNIGNIFRRKDEYDKAITYFLRASAEFKSLDDDYGIARVYNNLGSVAVDAKEYNTALSHYRKAYMLLQNQSNTESYALCKAGIGKSLMELGNYTEAIKELQEALQLTQQIELLDLQKQIRGNLSDVYERSGNYKKSLQEHKQFSILSDSILNQEKIRSTREMQVRYETEQRAREIEILQQEDELKSLRIKEQGTEIQRQRVILLVSTIVLILVAAISYLLFNRYRLKQEAQKDKAEKRALEIESRLLRSQMNPHFLFNSLNSIQSYISEANTFTAESYLSKFALLVRNILEYSRISTISLEDDLNALKLYIELEQLRFRGLFEYEVKLDDGLLDEELFVAPMLMQPFVENAIIHGLRHKSDQGKLTINLKKEEGLIRSEIKDDGVGRQKAGEYSKPGKKKSSLGMQVTKERFEILQQQIHPGASMQIVDLKNDNGTAAGTLVILLLPYEEDI